MVETRHIKLDYEEALDAKKQLLNCQLNLLNIVKRLRAYGALRGQERGLKGDLRGELGGLRSKLNLVLSTFPIEGKKVKKKVSVEGKGQRSAQEELEAIRKKLSKLGG